MTTIEENAFKQTNITKFRWPEKCDRIPANCFYQGELEKITSIDHVKYVGDSAFEYSEIEEII